MKLRKMTGYKKPKRRKRRKRKKKLRALSKKYREK